MSARGRWRRFLLHPLALLLRSLALLPLALAASLSAGPACGEQVRESHSLFGSLLEITVDSEDRETGQNRIRDAVAVARRLEALLDLADGSSAVARLNAKAGRGSLRVPLDLYRLLALSQVMTRSTGGAFDVTVGPLLKRRQVAATDRSARVGVGEALALVGAGRIVLLPPDGAELAVAGMSVDFGAIARGYALERMAVALRKNGVTRALLEYADSTVLAIGPPDGQAPFRVRVAHGKSTVGTVALRNRSLSTLRVRRRGEDGAPFAIVDPRSGRFVDAERQASVVARDAAIAEAWSAALVVDPDGALGLLEEPRDVEALVFDEHGEHRSPRFDGFAGWKNGSPPVERPGPEPLREPAAPPAAVAPSPE